MSGTIGNPGSWAIDHAKAAGEHIGTVVGHVGLTHTGGQPMPRVRHLAVRDLREVLRKGVEDFAACRTDVAFLCVLYPVIGILLAWIALDRNLLPLLFPVMSGFALIGPVAAVGLYEMSRRRELGEEPDWAHAFEVVKSPSFGAILALGLMLAALFIVWVLTAHGIYFATLRRRDPGLDRRLRPEVFTTGAGWTMIDRRLRGRVSLRGAGAGVERGVLPAAARPRRRAAGGGDHLDAGRRRQPGADRGLGADRRGAGWCSGRSRSSSG